MPSKWKCEFWCWLWSFQTCVQAASNSMLLQREASALNAQPPAPKWPVAGTVSSEQLSLELHHVEREIGKRTREIALVSLKIWNPYASLHSFLFDHFGGSVFVHAPHVQWVWLELVIYVHILLMQENQAVQEVQFKLKATENGQSEHKAQLEELSLALRSVHTHARTHSHSFTVITTSE